MKTLRIYADLAMSPEELELLRTGISGHELILPAKPAASVLVQAERDPQLTSVDVAFGQPDPQALMESARLRWVQISSSGITRYDTPQFRAAMASRGVRVSNSAAVYAEPCAVHALSFMLAQARKLPLGLHTRTAGGTETWHALRAASGTLRGESVLIVGYGAIGCRLVELLRPFDVAIQTYRRRARGDEGVPVVTGGDGLAAALAWADHVVNILPESAETRRFFGSSRFAAMKPGAAFYNIGRGATVDQEALLEVLRLGRLGAAWLDVTEPEPLPDSHPLWSEPNCFITPHVAGGHTGEVKTLIRHFLRNLERLVLGETLLDRVM